MILICYQDRTRTERDLLMLNIRDIIQDKTMASDFGFMMNQISTQFYLTGSRYFGGAQDNSDWDFFAEYSEELALELGNYGFEKNSAYKSHIDVSVVYKKGNIHIQLVSNIEEKIRIQELIKRTILMCHMSHTQRKSIWHLAYAAYREKKSESVTVKDSVQKLSGLLHKEKESAVDLGEWGIIIRGVSDDFRVYWKMDNSIICNCKDGSVEKIYHPGLMKEMFG